MEQTKNFMEELEENLNALSSSITNGLNQMMMPFEYDNEESVEEAAEKKVEE